MRTAALLIVPLMAGLVAADTSARRGGVDYRRFTELSAFDAPGSWYLVPGARFVCVRSSDEIRLLDGATGKEMGRLTGLEGIHDAGFSANGRVMATAADNPTVRVWDLDTMTEIRNLQPHDGYA